MLPRCLWWPYCITCGHGHFERADGGSNSQTPDQVQLRQMESRGPGDPIESPYAVDAWFRSKAGTSGTGYIVYLTKTCDENITHFFLHADTMPANVHEAMRTEPIHAALAAKDLAPAEHLVKSAYVSA